MKILFLLKKKHSSGGYSSEIKAGLYNSASFVKEKLDEIPGIETDLRLVIDGNGIDKELHDYRPDVCILEALWVTPTKLKELANKYSDIVFILRVHSKISFLAVEGLSIKWIKEYNELPNVFVTFNEKDTYEDFNKIDIESFYTPNIYRDFRSLNISFKELIKLYANYVRSHSIPLKKYFPHNDVHVGCFGALRPMKNQLLQAVAAMQFANCHDLNLFFHINGSRSEQGGENVLKNIRALFEGTRHTLVENGWLPHDEFLSLIKKMDVGLQVSFSESFNIVSADFVSVGVPIIASEEVEWLPDVVKVKQNSSTEIKNKLEETLKNKTLFVYLSQEKLKKYNAQALQEWINFLFG